MTELEEALALAEKLLDEPNCDPDDDLRMLARQLTRQREAAVKLQVFKDWVHTYLDNHKVPHHPPGTHGAEGCRIGDRMDWLMAYREDQRKHIKELEAELHVRRQGDPTGDLIHANRDQILKMHEEAVRRIGKVVRKYVNTENGIMTHYSIGALDCKMVCQILQALSLFHPMHEWQGWPEGSEP